MPRTVCPNDCSGGGGKCNRDTGQCHCITGRRGIDCSLQFCRLLHRWCASCDDIKGCSACDEGYFVANTTLCLPCTVHDPRCAACNRDRCLSCADPLLSSQRRSGRRRVDPPLPFDELLERQLSRAFPFGTQDPRFFEDAEGFVLSDEAATQTAAGMDGGAFSFFDACVASVRDKQRRKRLAEAQAAAAAAGLPPGAFSSSPSEADDTDDSMFADTADGAWNSTVVRIVAATGPDLELGLPRAYAVDCALLPYYDVYMGFGPASNQLELPVLGPVLGSKFSPLLYPPTRVWNMTTFPEKFTPEYATKYSLEYPSDPRRSPALAGIAQQGMAATFSESAEGRRMSGMGFFNTNVTVLPDPVVKIRTLVGLSNSGHQPQPGPNSKFIPLLNASSFECHQGIFSGGGSSKTGGVKASLSGVYVTDTSAYRMNDAETGSDGEMDDTWHCKRTRISHTVCGHAGTLVWDAPTYAVLENGRFLRVGVNRTGGGLGRVTVEYELLHGTTDDADVSATAPYTTSRFLVFEPGVVRLTFLITIHDDLLLEGEPIDRAFPGKAPAPGLQGTTGPSFDYNWKARLSPHESFQLKLRNPCCGAALGAQHTTTVAIIDDDALKVVPWASTAEGPLTMPAPSRSDVIRSAPPSEGSISNFLLVSSLSPGAVTASKLLRDRPYVVAGQTSRISVTGKDYFGRPVNGSRNSTLFTASIEGPGYSTLLASGKAFTATAAEGYPYVNQSVRVAVNGTTEGAELFLVAVRTLSSVTVGTKPTVVFLGGENADLEFVWDTATQYKELTRKNPSLISVDTGNMYSYAGRYINSLKGILTSEAGNIGYVLPQPGPHDAISDAAVAFQHLPTMEITATYNATTRKYDADVNIQQAGLHSVTITHCMPGGLRADYWTNAYMQGLPALTRVDPAVNFTWSHGPIFKLEGCTPTPSNGRRGSTYGDLQSRIMTTANLSSTTAAVSGTAGGTGLSTDATPLGAQAAAAASAAAKKVGAVGAIPGAGVGGPANKCSSAGYADFVSVRWSGKVYVAPGQGGVYELYVAADDGVRLYIDHSLMIDAWGTPGQAVNDFSDASHDADQIFTGANYPAVGLRERTSYLSRFLTDIEKGGEGGTVKPSMIDLADKNNSTDPVPYAGSTVCTYGRLGQRNVPGVNSDQDTSALRVAPDVDLLCVDGSADIVGNYIKTNRDRVAAALPERFMRTYNSFSRIRQVLETASRVGLNSAQRTETSLRVPVIFAGGHLHDVVLEYRDLAGHAACRLLWVTPGMREEALRARGMSGTIPQIANRRGLNASDPTVLAQIAAEVANITASGAITPVPVPSHVLYSTRHIANMPSVTYVHPTAPYASGPAVNSTITGDTRDVYTALNHPDSLPPPYQAASDLALLQPPEGSFAVGPGLSTVRAGEIGNFTISSRDIFNNDRGILAALDSFIISAVALIVDPQLHLEAIYSTESACKGITGSNAVKMLAATTRERVDVEAFSTAVYTQKRVTVAGETNFNILDGLIYANWNPVISGVYALSIVLSDNAGASDGAAHHAGFSPYIVDVPPIDDASPLASVVTGSGAAGSNTVAVASQVNAILVQPRDRFSNSILLRLPVDAFGKGSGKPVLFGSDATVPNAPSTIEGASGVSYAFGQRLPEGTLADLRDPDASSAVTESLAIRALDPNHPLVKKYMVEVLAFHTTQAVVIQADVVAIAVPVLPPYKETGNSTEEARNVQQIIVNVGGLDIAVTPPVTKTAMDVPAQFMPTIQKARKHMYAIILVALYRPTVAGTYRVTVTYTQSAAPLTGGGLEEAAFYVKVVPGPTYHATSTVHFQPFWSYPGPANGTLVVRDRFGNVREGEGVVVVPEDDNVTISITAKINNAYRVVETARVGVASYSGIGAIYNLTMPCTGFECFVTVLINGKNASGSPFVYRRLAEDAVAETSNAWGPGLTAGTVGEPGWFLMQTRDESGNARFRPAPPIDSSRATAWVVRLGGVRPDVVEQMVQPSTAEMRNAKRAAALIEAAGGVATLTAAEQEAASTLANQLANGIGVDPLLVPEWYDSFGEKLDLGDVPITPVLVGAAVRDLLPRVPALYPSRFINAKYLSSITDGGTLDANVRSPIPLVGKTPYVNSSTLPDIWSVTQAEVAAGVADNTDLISLAPLERLLSARARGLDPGPDVFPAYARALPDSDGLVYFEYTVYRSGVYAVLVELDNRTIIDCPRLVPIVSRSLESSRSEILGQAAASIYASGSSSFTIVARDMFANRVSRSAVDGDFISALLIRIVDSNEVDADPTGAASAAMLTKEQLSARTAELVVTPQPGVPGSYQCSYSATVTGTYLLDVRYTPADAGIQVEYYRQPGFGGYVGGRQEPSLSHVWTYQSLYNSVAAGDAFAGVIMGQTGSSVRKYGYFRPLLGLRAGDLAMLTGSEVGTSELVTFMVESTGSTRLLLSSRSWSRIADEDALNFREKIERSRGRVIADENDDEADQWITLVDTDKNVGRLSIQGKVGTASRYYASIQLSSRRFYAFVLDYQEKATSADQQPCLSGCILRVQMSSRTVSPTTVFGYDSSLSAWRGIDVPRLMLFPPSSFPVAFSPYYVFVQAGAAYAPACLVRFINTAEADSVTALAASGGNPNTNYDAVYAASNEASFVVTLRDRFNNSRGVDDAAQKDKIIVWAIMVKPIGSVGDIEVGAFALRPIDFTARYIGHGQQLVTFRPMSAGLYSVFIAVNPPDDLFGKAAVSTTMLEDYARDLDILVNPNGAYSVLAHIVPSTLTRAEDASMRSVIYGPGASLATVGDEAEFFVQLKDAAGNNVTGYNLTLCSGSTGVSFSGAPLCRVSISIVWQTALPGQRDTYGVFDPRYPRPMLDPTARSNLKISPTLTYANAEGTVRVRYIASTSGFYELNVAVLNVTMLSSPVRIQVRSTVASARQSSLVYDDITTATERDRFNAALNDACRAHSGASVASSSAVCTRANSPVLTLSAPPVGAKASEINSTLVYVKIRDKFANPLVETERSVVYAVLKPGPVYDPNGPLQDVRGVRQWFSDPGRDFLVIDVRPPPLVENPLPELRTLSLQPYWLAVHMPLTPQGTGLTARYYESWRRDLSKGSVPALVRTEAQIANSNVWLREETAQFSAVDWDGFVRTDRDADYSFTFACDGPCTVDIDGKRVVDYSPDWVVGGPILLPKNTTGTLSMYGNQLYAISLRLLRLTDPAGDLQPGHAMLYWSYSGGLGVSNDVEVIPQRYLVPADGTAPLSNSPIPVLVTV
jgi:hypothetical protein